MNIWTHTCNVNSALPGSLVRVRVGGFFCLFFFLLHYQEIIYIEMVHFYPILFQYGNVQYCFSTIIGRTVSVLWISVRQQYCSSYVLFQYWNAQYWNSTSDYSTETVLYISVLKQYCTIPYWNSNVHFCTETVHVTNSTVCVLKFSVLKQCRVEMYHFYVCKFLVV